MPDQPTTRPKPRGRAADSSSPYILQKEGGAGELAGHPHCGTGLRALRRPAAASLPANQSIDTMGNSPEVVTAEGRLVEREGELAAHSRAAQAAWLSKKGTHGRGKMGDQVLEARRAYSLHRRHLRCA